jgi:hypothetical protein
LPKASQVLTFKIQAQTVAAPIFAGETGYKKEFAGARRKPR